nr:non-structural maintenance of chromosomes element 3 homolog isoform X3 [Pelodiscus sinensis]XP_006130452.1 non-structural maintenance of chromosomes element 3 homolog isoform X3 [Pelodiscus sinensis]XP_025044118.1 non-structural maintenance of chromosomes element 3 homolog isoform X3 [Pelodiscus sinensis]|eukprot:XP_006130451.1 non-structural maintenance of chromosomes element 3 homolog isoform X3 [Pelodiscus sinensis]
MGIAVRQEWRTFFGSETAHERSKSTTKKKTTLHAHIHTHCCDILKNIIKDYKGVYSEIIKRASRTLQQVTMVFGLQLVEIDTKHHIYILVSNLPRLEGEDLKQDDSTAKLGLLTVILSFLFMKGNAAKESAVWEMLRRLRIDPGMRHEVFGDVKKLVTEEFVRQKYLEYNRIPHTDPPEFEFQWGARAAKETSKMQILRFVAKIQSKDPEAWSTQYNEAAAEVTATGGLFQDTRPLGDTGGASQGARRRNRSAHSQPERPVS